MLKKFDIIKVSISHSDEEKFERPAMLILDESENFSYIQACLITANFSPKYNLDIALNDYFEMGLPTKCFLRVQKIICIDKNLINTKVGELPYDLREVFDKRLKEFLL
ncbi:MAG: type II toxin-antitoxin system PemK/MazF family toxin [Rickettsiales bacterium]|nr:type II toxin-antitoxin system PemK/MazF family toxin [Rickettsiales bacterium]